jgi:hypothetical protein
MLILLKKDVKKPPLGRLVCKSTTEKYYCGISGHTDPGLASPPWWEGARFGTLCPARRHTKYRTTNSTNLLDTSHITPISTLKT